jgi:hypothetical protein
MKKLVIFIIIMDKSNTFKLDKTAFKILKKGSEPKSSEYWLSQTPESRISAIEFLRKQYYGTQSRLQRVYRITKQK